MFENTIDNNYESPMTKLSQFIGDYSQNVLHCSYNQGEVRELWYNRKLKDMVRDVIAVSPRIELFWKHNWSQYYDALDINSFMDHLVRMAGGWPVDWNSHYVSGISPLTKEEMGMLGEETIFPLQGILDKISEQTKNSTNLQYDQTVLLMEEYRKHS